MALTNKQLFICFNYHFNYYLNQSKKTKNMGGFLYTIAVVLVILWAIGYFAYGAGAIIHLLLMIAIIAVLLRVIQGK
jgi:hypothetical protein